MTYNLRMHESTVEEILERLKPFMGGTGGFDSWLTGNSSEAVVNRLAKLRSSALSCSQLNQLLALAHRPELTEGAFKYLRLPLRLTQTVKTLFAVR